MRPCFPISQCLRLEYVLPKFLPRFKHIRRIQTVLAKLVKPCLVSCRNRMIFNHCPKRNHWPFECFSESPFIKSFPICQEVLDISQIAKACHRIKPPFFVQTRLQNSSADVPSFTLRAALSAIPCVCDLCGVDVQ